ncbi:MAG: hypothetical protein R2878_05510 [Thermoleophilia bacterium]
MTTDIGIPLNHAVAGCCTMIRPPASLMARAPQVPSLPVPDNTTPTASGPHSPASDAKEPVDRKVQERPVRALDQPQATILEDHVAGGRFDQDPVGQRQVPSSMNATGIAVCDLEQFHHAAVLLSREVLNDDERHPGLARNVLEETLQGIDAPCRAPMPTSRRTARSTTPSPS